MHKSFVKIDKNTTMWYLSVEETNKVTASIRGMVRRPASTEFSSQLCHSKPKPHRCHLLPSIIRSSINRRKKMGISLRLLLGINPINLGGFNIFFIGS